MSNHPNNNSNNNNIAPHVFNGSTTLAGVSVTIIALFRVMQIGLTTYADEILAADTVIFFTAALLSYMALRRKNYYKIEKAADILFFSGLIIMMIAGVMIVVSTYRH